MYRVIALVPLLFVACSKGDSASGASGATSASSACAKATPHGPLSWIEDDYAAALACAKEKKLPLVLDLWAPWCHTCLSMQSTVFTDPSFAARGKELVFVALDTDREVNAAAVAKFPLSAWPTFYVINTDETVLARFVGAASKDQFHAFLDAGMKAIAGVEGAAKHLLAAERAIASKDHATAESELTAALAAAPKDWVRRPDALVSLINTKRKRGDLDGCLMVGAASMDEPGTTASVTDFVGIALDCAESKAKDDPKAAATIRERAINRLQALIDDPKALLSVDDRSDAMVYLREVLDTVGRTPDAINLAEKQRMMLDEAAGKAKTPMAAMTYNWQRAEVYVFLGRPLEIVPALEQSATDLPKEYDPPARLGWVYLKAGKLEDAAKWTDTALALAYGPRKARVLSQRADIAAKQGDLAAEKKFRAETVKLWESLPPGQANADALAKAKEALAKLDAAPAPGGSGSAAGSAAGSGSAASGSATGSGSARGRGSAAK